MTMTELDYRVTTDFLDISSIRRAILLNITHRAIKFEVFKDFMVSH